MATKTLAGGQEKTTAPRDRRWWLTTVVGAVALVVGLGIGFAWGNAGSEQSAFPTGRFVGVDNANHVFVFNPDGTYEYSEADYTEGDPDVSGAYGISGDLYAEMTHDFEGSAQVPATYRWSFDGTVLSFELVGEDVLPSRQEAMTGQDYAKADE